jgi:hypothetical protein
MTSFTKLSKAIPTVVMVLGWLGILHFHEYRVSPGVFFLAVGWGALVLVFYLIARAYRVVGAEVFNEGFGQRRDRRQELDSEKKALLRAIKDAEFDRDTGKMNDDDAKEIIQFYRQRAIAILKELDDIEKGRGPASPREEIERELKARLVLSGSKQEGA